MHFIIQAVFVILIPVICANLPSSTTTDVNSLISPYSNCLIILHEFTPTFLVGSINHPVILTRFYKKQREGMRNILKANYKEMGGRSADFQGWKPFTNFTFSINPRPIYLNCLVEFFLGFPLQEEEYLIAWKSYGPFIEVPKVLPQQMKLLYSNHLATRAFYHKYRILVTTERNWKLFDKWIIALMERVADLMDMADRMVYQVSEDGLTVEKVYLVCEYCNPSSHTYETYKEALTLPEITKGFNEINKINNGVPWHMFNYRLSAKDWAKLLNKMKQYYMVYPMTFRSFQPWMTLEFILLKMVAPNNSITSSKYQTMSQCSKNLEFEIKADCLVKRLAVPEIQIGYQFVSQYFGIYSEERIKFLTCDGFKVTYDIDSFISSYTLGTWLAIFCSAVTVSIVLQLGFKLKQQGPNKLNTFLMPWSILVEQGDDIMGNKSQETFAFWICGTWLLMAIILSNAYKGRNVTQLTSPLSPDYIRTFGELAETDFKIYNRPRSDQTILNLLHVTRNIRDRTWYESVGNFQNTEIGTMTMMWQRNMDPKLVEGSAFSRLFNIVRRFQVPANIVDIIVGKNGTYVDSISECNKTVLAAWKDEVELGYYVLKARRPDKFVSMGEEELLISTKGFIISNWVYPGVLTNIAALLHSGLASQWQKVARNSKLVPNLMAAGRGVQSSLAELSLNGNTAVVFLAYAIVLGAESLIFSCEIAYMMIRRKGFKTSVYPV